MAKKRTFGVSPKGALILREREEQRRRNLPQVEVIRDGALKRVQENPLLKLMAEFPMLPPIDIDVIINPDVQAALDYSLLTVRGAAVARNKLPWDKPFHGMPFITHPADGYDPLKIVTDHLINPLTTFDPGWELKVINAPGGGPDKSFVLEPGISANNKFSVELVEDDSGRISKWLQDWGVGYNMPFVIKPETEEPARRYKLRKANARAEVGPADNNYRDFHDTIHSWYSKDAEPREYRRYAIEEKLCNNLDRLTSYFGDFKERSGGTRLSGLDITIGWEADDLFKLLVTEVFYKSDAMLLVEVVTTVPNMRPMGYARFFKDASMANAMSEDRMYNIFFNDVDVFGRDQLDQFLDIVVYCLDKGVREEISYYG